MNDTCPTCGYTTSNNYCERFGCGKMKTQKECCKGMWSKCDACLTEPLEEIKDASHEQWRKINEERFGCGKTTEEESECVFCELEELGAVFFTPKQLGEELGKYLWRAFLAGFVLGGLMMYLVSL